MKFENLSPFSLAPKSHYEQQMKCEIIVTHPIQTLAGKMADVCMGKAPDTRIFEPASELSASQKAYLERYREITKERAKQLEYERNLGLHIG